MFSKNHALAQQPSRCLHVDVRVNDCVHGRDDGDVHGHDGDRGRDMLLLVYMFV